MDSLTRFPQTNIEVSLASEGGNTIDSIVAKLSNIEREQILLRKGQEVGIYGEEVKEMEDVELEEVPLREVENA